MLDPIGKDGGDGPDRAVGLLLLAELPHARDLDEIALAEVLGLNALGVFIECVDAMPGGGAVVVTLAQGEADPRPLLLANGLVDRVAGEPADERHALVLGRALGFSRFSLGKGRLSSDDRWCPPFNRNLLRRSRHDPD